MDIHQTKPFTKKYWIFVASRVAERIYPRSILHKSIAGRYRPVRVVDGPITTLYRFIKNASWAWVQKVLAQQLEETDYNPDSFNCFCELFRRGHKTHAQKPFCGNRQIYKHCCDGVLIDSNTPRLYSQWLNSVIYYATNYLAEARNATWRRHFDTSLTVILRFHHVRRFTSFFPRQNRKKCMQTSALQSKLLAGFL